MKAILRIRAVLIALLAIGSGAGCYTLLKHPRLQTEDKLTFSHQDERVSFADDCASCHNASTMVSHWMAVPSPGQFVSPRWNYYYDYPWWIPYYSTDDSISGSEEMQHKQRSFDRRHISKTEEPNPPQISTPQPTPASATPTLARPVNSGENPTPDHSTSRETSKGEEKRSGEESKKNERRTRKP